MPDEPDAIDAYREFAREMMLRFEAAIRAFSREMAALHEETRELREDSRAQTQALMRILDRLENGGAAAG
jgi:hypothetical protein